MTAIISPEGRHLAPPLTSGEGILVADLDLALITKRKRMMDSVGHYARPELLSLVLDNRSTAPMRAVDAFHPQSFIGSRLDASVDSEAGAERVADGGVDQRLAVLRSSAR
jgi:aliphatic nitrilase